MLCFYFLCVTVRLSFCELKFLYERQGTVTAQTTLLLLDCLHLFFYLFMIIKKGKENQVPSNCVLISHCQNHNQRTWMCSTIFFGGGSLFNSKGEKRVRQSIIHLFSWLTSNYSQLIQNDSLSLNITKCHERNKKTRPTEKIHLILLNLLQRFLCWHLLLVNSLDRCVASFFFSFLPGSNVSDISYKQSFTVNVNLSFIQIFIQTSVPHIQHWTAQPRDEEAQFCNTVYTFVT